MKGKYCFNDNYACAMRGMDANHPNQTETTDVADEETLVEEILDVVFGNNLDDVIEDGYDDAELTMKWLIEYANDQDISGGWPVLFWVEVDGKRYDTIFDEEDFADADEEPSPETVAVKFHVIYQESDDDDSEEVEMCLDTLSEAVDMAKDYIKGKKGYCAVTIGYYPEYDDMFNTEDIEDAVGYDEYDTVVLVYPDGKVEGKNLFNGAFGFLWDIGSKIKVKESLDNSFFGCAREMRAVFNDMPDHPHEFENLKALIRWLLQNMPEKMVNEYPYSVFERAALAIADNGDVNLHERLNPLGRGQDYIR